MVYKILGVFIMLAAGSIGFLVFKNDLSLGTASQHCQTLTPAQQLAEMIGKDFENLQQQKQLPKAWNSIASMEIKMNSILAKALLGQQPLGFKRLKEGKYFLEVDFLDLPDDHNPGIILQASLFDIKSKNKVFEIGRTYSMAELNRTSNSSSEKAPSPQKED